MLVVAAACFAAGCCGTARTDACAAVPPLPPEAQVGEAWCLVETPPRSLSFQVPVVVREPGCKPVWVPPLYGTCIRNERVCDARWRTVKVPAVFEDVEERVLLCPGRTVCGCDYPPVWGTCTKRVCVQPETTREECIPAVWKSVEECVMLRPGCWTEVPVPGCCGTKTETHCFPGCAEWRRNEACEVPEAPPVRACPCPAVGG